MFFNKNKKIRGAIHKADRLVESMFENDNVGFITFFATELEFETAKRRLKKRHGTRVKVDEIPPNEYALFVTRLDLTTGIDGCRVVP